MRMLSVDANTKDTGLVLWEDGKPITTASVNLRLADRREMARLIIDRALMARADVVAIEDVYAGSNPKTTILLSKLVGGIEALALGAGMQALSISTAEIDAACGVPSGIDRKERKARIKAVASLELEDGYMQDIYDAWAVGNAALGILKTQQWAREPQS